MTECEIERGTLTLMQGARHLGISRSLAYQLAATGKFPGVRRLGRRYVVSRKALQAYLEGPQSEDCLDADRNGSVD